MIMNVASLEFVSAAQPVLRAALLSMLRCLLADQTFEWSLSAAHIFFDVDFRPAGFRGFYIMWGTI